jgi:hypothetical protein
MIYRINISNNSVSKETHIETYDNKCNCLHVSACFNIDCEDCIFDNNKEYSIDELIHRIKLK